jgi:transcriptional regulator with XRE-family HTH domain
MVDDKDKQILKPIGRRLAAARNKKGRSFTQAKVAELANISETHYAQIEQGNTNPTILVFKKIIEVIGVSSSDILGK